MRGIQSLYTAALALGATVLFASSAWSQELDPGERIRVKTISAVPGQVVGVVEAREADFLEVLSEQGIMTRIAWDDVSRLQVSRGYKSNAGKGALIGLGVGGATGLILALATCAPDEIDCQGLEGSFGVAGAISFGAFGAGLGALIGLVAKSERWVDVPPSRWEIQVAPDPNGGVALGVRLRM